MKKKEVLELKRRLKKDEASFTRLAGCYVDCNKNKVYKFGTKFLTLEEDEYYKYLEIANKSLSGKLGNNLLNLSFPLAEEEIGGRQQLLMAMRESRLENETLLDTYYDLVIDTYDNIGNYLILLFYDSYDVMIRTTDNNSLDESEEVYNYLICSICPVTLSKPGLGFLETEQRIGPRVRDWIVGTPETAFLFPAFNDRSTDIHSVLFYTKNTKEPHCEFMTNGLGCGIERTATEQKMAFHSIIRNVLGAETDETEKALIDIQQNLNELVEEYEENRTNDEEVLILDNTLIEKILEENNVSSNNINRIKKSLDETFGIKMPEAENVIDEKALAQNLIRLEMKELEQQVCILSNQLSEKQAELNTYTNGISSNDILLRMNDNQTSSVVSRMIDGKKHLVIPLEDENNIIINGISTSL